MSSLLYLGVSIIAFFIMFGFLSMLVPIILGSVFSSLDTIHIENEVWRQIYQDHKELAEFLVPLTFSMGIVVAVVKIIMVATSKGRD